MSTFSKENTNEIFEDIIRNLSRGVKDRKHDFHTPVFSNINNQNSIESRVVVLRDFDVENMILNFHTDFRSPKVEDLAKNENSLFVFYDYKLKVQLRIKTISIDINLQGKEPSKEESEKGYKNFTVVQNKIKEIDWLYLEASGHRRLKITFKENIKNFEWLIP